MFLKLAVTCGTLAMTSATSAAALTLVLDDFSTYQVASATPTSSNMVSGGGTTGISALSRSFEVQNTAFAGVSAGATQLQSAGGFLSFNNNSGARGSATVTYTGVGDLMNSREKGYFFFDVVAFDGNAEFSLVGEDGSGNLISYNELLTSGYSPTLRFTELTGYESFDFSDISSLSLTIDSTNTADSVDGRLASISVASVPLPASALLMLIGAGGLAMVRRARKDA